MHLAFFSPLPPSRSGIADYSAALLERLRHSMHVDVFDSEPQDFSPEGYDAILYQVGNNPDHAFVYDAALKYPGVVVMHEANLHHLVAEMTIRRGDWDSYLSELELNGGAQAVEYGRRVQALEAGPDYDGVPMLRRLLGSAKALVAHSHTVEASMRAAGFTGPVAVIPHGAWLLETDRMGYRVRLGIDHSTPLIGVFGHLKPYKRIPESLRAFRRLRRVQPHARMILVGEPHPDLPLQPLITSLGLSGAVRVLGRLEMDDFSGCLGACDIVLNLRYPTVGETSGTLLRALGLGKAVLISGIGTFREFPAEICLHVPVDATEEDVIFEYLNLLVSRPDLAAHLGAKARTWVERECNWDLVSSRYTSFLKAVTKGTSWQDEKTPEAHEDGKPSAASVSVEPEYLLGWSSESGSREYFEVHRARLLKTLEITPPGEPGQSVLEMGAYFQITPALKTRLGYEEVRGCYYGTAGMTEHRKAISLEGEEFECDLDLFDAEKDTFPYPDETFSTVLCCELLEHLFEDPMHMMSEINRILKTGGHLVLTTPNICSLRAIAATLTGYHPGFFQAYILPKEGEEPDPRHNREYAPREISMLFTDAGFEVKRLETGPFRDAPRPELGWVSRLLEYYSLPGELRGDGIYAVGRKSGPVRERYPEWLYSGGG
ncbi:MAG: glycosyltransferase [Bryobacteraceae bacterium]|nr:glycosyltransferase [Bryobacterales bacterium]NUN02056.1 glycosyltransferase [Bryobacteraceae bacterium]